MRHQEKATVCGLTHDKFPNPDRDRLVSVVMPVYNAQKYLRLAIDSILNQSFDNFELLVIDDGSSDDSLAVIKSYHDPRIRIIINDHNCGIIDTLNRGLAEARGQYVARMDADDISLPDRLKQQVEFLEQHPLVGLVGTTFLKISDDGAPQAVSPSILDHELLQASLLFENPFGHGSIMIRRTILDQLPPPYYDRQALTVEDLNLWSRLAIICRVANLAKVLYIWRDQPLGISAKNFDLQRQNVSRQMLLNRKNWRSIISAALAFRYNPADYTNQTFNYQGVTVPLLRAKSLAYLWTQLARISFQHGALVMTGRLLWRAWLADRASLLKAVSAKLGLKS